MNTTGNVFRLIFHVLLLEDFEESTWTEDWRITPITQIHTILSSLIKRAILWEYWFTRIWMSKISRIPRKEKFQWLQSLFRSRAKLQFQMSTKYISYLLFSYTLQNETELLIKTKYLKGRVWFLWSFSFFNFVLFSLRDETAKTMNIMIPPKLEMLCLKVLRVTESQWQEIHPSIPVQKCLINRSLPHLPCQLDRNLLK